MLTKALKVLKKHFGYSSFRKGQEKIISSILEGSDTFGIMPTGGGKSICYQVPALLFPGITLVISPLISLMKDQVDALDNLGVPSAYINSSLSSKEFHIRISDASKGMYKILYVAPERLESDIFLEVFNHIPVSLLAIDEAHCVSQWGHDFRPSYRSIASLISKLPNRPIIAAFTATATEDVKNDIIQLLSLKNPSVYFTGFDRKNLTFNVIKGVKKSEFVIDYITRYRNQSGIIYAATRKEVDRLQQYLLKKGISVGKYHAGMSDDERNKNQENFIYDRVQVMVATNAFGMGIDKSNVRFVIHFNMPRNMEGYYQEAGRAGRDGDPAECILLYSASDVHIHKFLIEQTLLSPARKSNEYEKLQTMVDYCHTTGCLRKYILEYFGEEDVPQSCDNCSTCKDHTEISDITVEAQKIFSCIKRMGEHYGAALVANVLRGSNTKKIHQLGFNNLSTYGIMQDYTISEITNIISLLTAEDYLFVSGGQYPTLGLQMKAALVLQGKEKVIQRAPKKVQLKLEDTSLFDILRSLRKEISEEENLPPYVIFHDNTLKEMSKHLPIDRNSMLSISGVGESKFSKYGNRFIEAIESYIEENGLERNLPNLATQIVTMESSSSKRSSKAASHLLTLEKYKAGESLETIAKEREITLITVQEHIVKAFQEGHPVNWDDFIPTQFESLILQAIEKVGKDRLRPIKDVLPEEIDYFAIKAVLCKHG
ncbi:MAG: ATP-dependent helicase RecQ [Clostridiales bacterium]|jgi:ATP-dependent DNA helicase RecQ|nr:ATP-dependent helicase RecQ [Clostridiales bacterium]